MLTKLRKTMFGEWGVGIFFGYSMMPVNGER